MGKWVSITLVGIVLATITGMWFMFDRAAGRPAIDAVTGAGVTVGASADADPMDALKDRVKRAADDAKKAGEKAVEDATKAVTDAAQGAKMVQPEELPQGFIIVVTDKTKKASRESPIFMPSSHNGWNPGDKAMQLEPQSDMKWRIEWSKPKLDSRIAFKFTRGSWEAVETQTDFTNIDNRILPKVDVSKLAPGEKPVIELEIVQWKDNQPYDAANDPNNPYRPIKASAGTVKRLEVVGGVRAGLRRDLIVWLPPGYDAPENAQVTYPVLYMADGQNLFETVIGGPAAEWQADETAAKLIAEGKIQPLIIVGIPHAKAERISEYSPVDVVEGQPARGPQFVDWVRGHVMPRVERAFRVKTGPEHTAIGGASMGGLIALEAGTAYPDVFGKVLAESTPLERNGKAAFKHFGARNKWPERIYFGVGGKETSDAGAAQQMVNGAKAFAELAAGKGLTGDRFLLTIDDAAEHNEQAWAKRFPQALMYLFGK